MKFYRYVLSPYKGRQSRFSCPVCNSIGSYSRYIDLNRDEYLPFKYGRCNRANKCRYHLNPYRDGYNCFENTAFEPLLDMQYSNGLKKKVSQISYIPGVFFTQSLQRYDANNFVSFLLRVFPVNVVNELICKYSIGTSKHYEGGTVFWQRDLDGNIRTGKIMLYSPITGKRIRKPTPLINWVHSVLKLPDFNLQQCLFGAHLLKDFDSMPVAIVESEKTAIICSVYKPENLWLATGSLGNLTEKLCKVLIDREVTLFPDKNGYMAWSQKAEKLKYIKNLKISDFLENLGERIDKGRDLADYFLEGK